jgi:hypothetical protein
VFVKGKYGEPISEGFPARAAAWEYAENTFGVQCPKPKPNQGEIDTSNFLSSLFKESSKTTVMREPENRGEFDGPDHRN